MAAGTSTIRFLSAGPSGRVKKQLNDLFLYLSYKLHSEIASFGVVAVRSSAGIPRANGTATAFDDVSQIKYIVTDPNSETAKDWEANVDIWGATPTPAAPFALVKEVGQPDLYNSTLSKGGRVLVEIDSPVAGDVAWDCTLKLGAIRASDNLSNFATASGSITVTAAPTAAGTFNVLFAGLSTVGSPVTVAATDGTPAVATKIAAAINAGPDNLTILASVATGASVVVITSKTALPQVAYAISETTPLPTSMTLTNVGMTLTTPTNIPYQNYTFTITKGAGIGQAMTFVDDAGLLCDDIIAIDFAALAAGYASNGDGTANQAAGPALTGASRGVSIKVMTVPVLDADWQYHAFVRQINPNIPKDYKEVADHFDGAADTIRAISIPTLGIQKVFENVPGSFMSLRTRRVTMRADVKENNRFDASEVHYFLGVKGTPTIQFANDNESIASMECILYKWVTLS